LNPAEESILTDLEGDRAAADAETWLEKRRS
jgi:hypothetical protein